jgi:uncharacterized protein
MLRHHNRARAISMPLVLLAVIVLSLTSVRAQEPGKMTDRPFERSISIAATGSVAATPDRAAIATGVMTEAATAREAMALNSTSMKRLIDGLKAVGIEPRDIQTTAIQVNPRYTQGQGNRPPVINGYTALNQVRILVRALPKLGDILDQSLTLGANQMGGISFEVSNADALRDEARKLAIASARQRAELYATAAGVELGPVLSIAEGGHSPGPVFKGGARAAQMSAVPVEAGSIDLSVDVHVVWALK